jgi:hypothetical protein
MELSGQYREAATGSGLHREGAVIRQAVEAARKFQTSPDRKRTVWPVVSLITNWPIVTSMNTVFVNESWRYSGRTPGITLRGDIHSLTHGAEPFLKSRQLCSYSRTSQYFMEPEGSLLCSQELSTGPYPEPDQSSPVVLNLCQNAVR